MDKVSLMAIYPEIFLLVMSCAVLLIDLGVKSRMRSLTYYLTLATLAIAGAYYANALGSQIVPNYLGANSGIVPKFYGFGAMVVNDSVGNLLKAFACLAVFATLVYGHHYAAARGLLARGGELFSLALFSVLGICVLVSSANMLMVYLGLELLALSSYALVALQRDDAISTEAAIKYFVLGALASGFLLFGISLVYGATGHLELQKIFLSVMSAESHEALNPQLLALGLVFVVSGLAFKFSAAPFHMWAPDVYQGAPTIVTMMIATAPKLAAFALVVRLLVEGLAFMMPHWQLMLMILAVLSLLVGNIAAIAQTNIRRMLAFSTIAQIGFVFLGFSTGYISGDVRMAGVSYSASLVYVVAYILTSLAAFGVLLQLARDGRDVENISELAGLGKTKPFHALVLAITLFSFAGIPPLLGFFAKFGVLQPLLASPEIKHLYLALFAIFMSLIGCFYYLRVVKIMYFDTPVQTAEIDAGLDARSVLTLNGALVLVLGIVPGGLMTLCAQAVAQLFA